MSIGTNVWPGYEPLYFAARQGYLDRSEHRLEQFSAATDVIRAFRNDALDAACLTLDEALLLLHDGMDPQLLLVMDISNGGDVVMGNSSLTTLAQIKGKKIGVEGTALGPLMLQRALDQVDLTRADIEIVYMPVDQTEQAILEGRVDAVVTFEPVRSNLLQHGANILFDSSQIYGEIVDVLVVRDAYWRAHPDRIRRLSESWFRALADVEQNREAAAHLMASREGVSAEQFLRSLDGLELPGREENERLLYADPPALLPAAQKLVRYMRDKNLIGKEVDPRRLFTAAARRP